MEQNNYPISLDVNITISHIHLILEHKTEENWQRKVLNGREYDGFIYIVEGNPTFKLKDTSFVAVKNDIIFLLKGSKYEILGPIDKGIHYIVANFDVDNEEVLKSLNLNTVNKIEDTPFYKNLFFELEKFWHHKRCGFKMICSSILLQIIYKLLNENINQTVDYNKVKKIQKSVDYIENYYSDNGITIEKLSSMSNISTNHFRRLFKEVYGISPLKYLNSIRVGRAIDLLNSGIYTITDIAEVTGYTNVYYFSRLFKEVTGESPMKYKSNKLKR